MNVPKTERLHALDSLRATMMLLGLVLHSAITYGEINHGTAWPLKDPAAAHASLDYLVSLIHVFRMPIFFIVAGFFGALLFYERSPWKMLKNRRDRIVYPFIVFLFVLWPGVALAFNYSGSVLAGNASPVDLSLDTFIALFIPPETFHLWFLYYLAMITLVSFGLGLLFRQLPNLSRNIHLSFSRIIKKPITRLACFSGLTFLMFWSFQSSWANTSSSYIPDLNTFSFYFFFYIVGWIQFKSKQLLDEWMRFDWQYTVLALILFQFRFSMSSSWSTEMTMAVNAVMVWLFSFGISGLFLRFCSKHSARMRYISDSSYWIYLVHLSLTAFIPGLIAHWRIPAIAKFLVVFSVATGICLVTYHYLVRATYIGLFLNGRRFPRT